MPETEEALTRTAYNVVADVYADHFRTTEGEQPIDLAMINHFVALLHEPRVVLDAGCGAGRMLPYLAGLGCHPEGIDLSPNMVRRARADHPAFTVAVGSLTHLPYAEEVFDGVFSWYSTIHNPDEDLEVMVAEMARVLRPEGVLLLGFQVGDGMRRVGRGYAARGYDVVMNRYHRSVESLTALLEEHGLTVSAQLERSPVGSEEDAQAVIIAQRSQPA
ncbi:methyltransferase domain-containing protein [Dermacoccus nishinomiyaensis]|uniref:class I SAM-dependent methyltransferase n=1 Tax=Dermacoccus nishinomiyaensis TaxID=1274 RepID=UPI00093D2DEE|nr:class I SAM-dependent methyltransferase [Dermacoccus nishinomiyaensis]